MGIETKTEEARVNEHVLLEQQFRLQYHLLKHKGYWTRAGYQDKQASDKKKPWKEELIYGEEALIKWARPLAGRYNLYLSRNPRTKDGQVCGISCFSLDIDPVREPETGSLPEQHSRALEAARTINQLESLGGSLASSGNGALLIVPFEHLVEPTEEFQGACKEFEREIIRKHVFPGVTIDATNYVNAVVKFLGCSSTKGARELWRVAQFCDPSHLILSRPRSNVLERIRSLEARTSSSVLSVGDAGSGTAQTMAVGSNASGLSASERLHLAEESLKRLNPERRDSYEDWLKVGIALKEFGPTGLGLWNAWSQSSSKYVSGVCEEKWRSFRNDQSLTVGTLKFWADQDDPERRLGSNLEGLRERSNMQQSELLIRDASSLFGPDEGTKGSPGIPSGFKWLDDHFNGGFKRGNLYAFEAVTSAGKTVAAVQLAYNLCKQDSRVLLTTTEMDVREVRDRFVACATGIPCSKVARPECLNGSRVQVEGFLVAARDFPFHVRESASPSIQELTQAVEQTKAEVLIFDYFQHVETGITTRATELATLARGLEHLAKAKNIVVIVTAQLHELYDFKTHKRLPSKKNDVKDSKSINDAASAVLVIDWLPHDGQNEDGPVRVAWRLEKNRHGPRGETIVQLNRQVPRFEV